MTKVKKTVKWHPSCIYAVWSYLCLYQLQSLFQLWLHPLRLPAQSLLGLAELCCLAPWPGSELRCCRSLWAAPPVTGGGWCTAAPTRETHSIATEEKTLSHNTHIIIYRILACKRSIVQVHNTTCEYSVIIIVPTTGHVWLCSDWSFVSVCFAWISFVWGHFEVDGLFDHMCTTVQHPLFF